MCVLCEMGQELGLHGDPFKNAQLRVMHDVAQERRRQDDEFGGASHNDQHQPAEWVAMIVKQLGKTVAHCTEDQASREYRQRMVNVAALAVAAVESYDRVGATGR